MLVTEHSMGMLKLDIKDKLYGLGDSALAVGDGRVDSGTQSVAAATGTYPLFDFGTLPGFIAKTPPGNYEYAGAFNDPRMREVFDKYTIPEGFKVIASSQGAAGNDIQWGSKPVRTLEDFNGLKTRTSGRTQTMILEALGASPVTLSTAEVEEALRRGTVDAITTAISYGVERGLMDICDYASRWPTSEIFAMLAVVNADTFNNLDPYYQEALLKAGEQLTWEMTVYAEGAYLTYQHVLRSSGSTEYIIPEDSEIEKAMALMGPVFEDWMEVSGPFSKDVLRIASDYATGPSADLVKSILAK